MKLKPVLTEKSLREAKKGNYTFMVDRLMNKKQIKRAVEEIFGVEVARVRTMNLKDVIKKDYLRRKKVIKGGKKAIVTLKGKGKIDLFEERKK